MYNNLFDFENQNIDFNIQAPKSKASNYNYSYKFDQNQEIYFGKDKKTLDQFNRKKTSSRIINNPKFESKKTIIKIVIYKNGYILNNGEFKDIMFDENKKFLREIEKGDIPIELIKKGIMNTEILLENRKNEIYPSTSNQNINNDLFESNIFQNSTQYQYQDQDLFSYLNNNDYKLNNEIAMPNPKMLNTFVSHNQNKSRNQKEIPLYNSNTVRVDNKHKTQKNKKRTNSIKKEKENKFVNFLDFKKEKDNKKEEKKDEENEKKKFKAFSGFGQLIGHVNTEGLYVNKSANTSADIYSPICHINIRLFNGEVVKAPFNYWQTLGDVYVYVKNLSGSDNFVLLDGFPPKPLRDYDRTIGQLKLENTTLTQRLNS
jgi:UBX domain-containing protein 1